MFEIRDEVTDVLLATCTTVADITPTLDRLCRDFDAQLAANAEGAAGLQMYLDILLVDDDGMRHWAGSRIYLPEPVPDPGFGRTAT